MMTQRNNPASPHSFLISVGEASGDNYGAQLMRSLGQISRSTTFFGMGGARMRAAGCELLVDAHEVAVVGLAEVLSHLPRIYGKFRSMVAEAEVRRPAAAILIDFPDFNLRLARQLHRLGIPVFYFISPQIWAWRPGRVKQIKKYVRKMIVIFPFEREFYGKHGVEVCYVGHPLAYAPAPEISRSDFALKYNLNARKQWIALLPGSRKKEVLMNLPAMLRAAEQLGGDYEYVLPVASTLEREWLQRQAHAAAARVKFTDDARVTLSHARAAAVASGTATVEAALSGTPFVVVYRVARLTWLFGRRLVQVDTFAMPSLIAGRRVVTELIQRDFTPENLMRELLALIPEGPRRQQMLTDLGEVRSLLRDSGDVHEPVMRAAREILAALSGAPS